MVESISKSSFTAVDGPTYTKEVLEDEEKIDDRLMSTRPILRRVLLCLGLVLVASMSGIDETIVATALDAISGEFQQSSQLTWVASAYLLTSTAFQPLYGKLSDIFGRTVSIMAALFLFMAGSIGCGLAISPSMLAGFRGLAGVGAGGLVALGFIILGDVVPLRQRSSYMSLINVTFGVSNVIGPLAGGLFVDHLNWRWVFYINIPIGVISIIVLLISLPKSLPVSSSNQLTDGKLTSSITAKLKRVDFLGSLTLVVGIVLLVLAMNWGGKEFSWSSAPVLTCLICGGLVLIGFVLIETYIAHEPILPWHIFNYNVVLASVATLVNGLIMFNFMYYWPLYHQAVNLSSATRAGMQVLPVLLSDGLLSAISGVLITRYGNYRWMMRLGMLLMLIGLLLLSFLPDKLTTAQEIILPLVVGLGIGFNTQTTLTAIQSAASANEVAIVTSFASFCLSMGGVLGLAIHGSIFTQSLLNQLQSTSLSSDTVHLLSISVDHLHRLSPDQQSVAIQAYLNTYHTLFRALLPVAGIGLLATLALRHIPVIPEDTTATTKMATVIKQDLSVPTLPLSA